MDREFRDLLVTEVIQAIREDVGCDIYGDLYGDDRAAEWIVDTLYAKIFLYLDERK